jgi:hypothetical protein
MISRDGIFHACRHVLQRSIAPKIFGMRRKVYLDRPFQPRFVQLGPRHIRYGPGVCMDNAAIFVDKRSTRANGAGYEQKRNTA